VSQRLSNRQRIAIFTAILSLAIALTFIASTLPATSSYGREISEELNSSVNVSDPFDTATGIAGHNLILSMLMGIPFVGVIIGLAIMGNTGYAISALTSFQAPGSGIKITGPVAFSTLALLPFFWLEFISYSIMMTQSITLGYSLIRGGAREEGKRTLMTLGIVTLLLVVGGFIEALIIYLTSSSP
jgi:hypothetical protein